MVECRRCSIPRLTVRFQYLAPSPCYTSPMRSLLIIVALMLCSLDACGRDISGTWSANVVLDAGTGNATFVLKQTGDTLAGSYSGALGEAKVTGSLKGDEVEWWFETEDAGKVVYRGKLEGASKIKGTVEYGSLGKGTFTAEKKN